MKNKMKNINKWIAGVSLAVVISFASCTKDSNLFDLNINVDPNNPTKGSVKLLLPEAERRMANWLNGLVQTQMGAVGQISASDSYGYGANGFYGSWSSFYTGWGKDVDEIIKAATEAKKSTISRCCTSNESLRFCNHGRFVRYLSLHRSIWR